MLNPTQIETVYKEIVAHLPQCAHDGIVCIDLKFLQEEGILDSLQDASQETEDLTQYFHVIESVEKVTLFNEQFIVWIIPKLDQSEPLTYVMIALNHPEKAQLEVVFMTKGVYNTPKYVLRVLQHYLADMLETQKTLTAYEKNGGGD